MDNLELFLHYGKANNTKAVKKSFKSIEYYQIGTHKVIQDIDGSFKCICNLKNCIHIYKCTNINH
ncbi:hypothetical protein ECANGB1_178 [Enterospora canceri]|uniref:Uncharacterized protein n=1 Tax=Enterospora canceri TaxID=1081671 RepID=A0A1Y1S592_9MICR|nr:hypothetical protein ECANGB1_178 [Enterospora canceri]